MLSDKAEIDRELLEKHGIIFSQNVYSPDGNERNGKETARVPEHVECIREALLECDIRVPDSQKSIFQRDLSIKDADYSMIPPQSVFFSVPQDLLEPMSREIKAKKDKFEHVATLSRIAKEYAESEVSQFTWAHFLRSYIFQDFEDSTKQTTKHGKLFDSWCLRSTLRWSTAAVTTDRIFEDTPEPSFTYGFPMHTDNTEKNPTGFDRNECIVNFSVNTLGDLIQITSCPVRHPLTIKSRMAGGRPVSSNDLICFPWALVEVQYAGEPAELCYCRAASGAYTALKIMEKLYQSAGGNTITPPVIAFTCCGPEIRMWLSFLELKTSKPSTKFICIWAGTLTATWCILTLREIVQNMTFWAARVLKPEISSRITRIRSMSSASQPDLYGTVSPRTAPQGIQTSKDPDTSKAETPMSTIKDGKETHLPFRRQKIRVLLPIHDERKPGRAASEERSPELSLPILLKDRVLEKKEDSKPDLEGSTPDSGIGETEAPKQSLILSAELEAPKKSSIFDAEPNYFIYRTPESFHGRSYDATVWGSEGDNDGSYVPSSSEPDSEDSENISLEGDNADDEESESTYSHDYETAHEEQLLQNLNALDISAEPKKPGTSNSLFLPPPGKICELTTADRDDLMYCAANAISGEDFTRLKSIQDLLENLKGVDLLDASWRSLEAWEGLNPNLFSFQMICLITATTHLNDFLALKSEKAVDDFKHHHLTMALRRKDLDQTLQAMQLEGDIYLQELIRLLLRGLNGEKCMEILSNELLELSPEEFEKVLQEAFDVVSSDTNLIGLYDNGWFKGVSSDI